MKPTKLHTSSKGSDYPAPAYIMIRAEGEYVQADLRSGKLKGIFLLRAYIIDMLYLSANIFRH